MIAIGEFGIIYVMVAAIIMRHRIADIFEKLTMIYQSRKLDTIN